MNQAFVILLCGLFCWSLVGCDSGASNHRAQALQLAPAEVQEGERVVRLQCATCHGIGENTQEEMLAPSLWAVRQHYIRKYPEPEAFVSGMIAFLDNPHEEDGLMPQAIEQYGLMLMLPLDPPELRAAVRLIAAGHVERPAWARDYNKAHQAYYDMLEK